MSFLEAPRFPGCPNFGYVSTPRYSVTITASASGRERRNRNWARPLYRFDVTVGPRAEDNIQELLEYWHAVGGSEIGFRFKDYADFKSGRVNQTPTALDQVLTESDDSAGIYQLTKWYTAGSRSQGRVIHKPIDGTILVANNGVLLTEGPQYTIDYTTGELTLLVTPNGDITWGGEFDTPVRFDSEFPVELVNWRAESVSFALMEIRDPINEEFS